MTVKKEKEDVRQSENRQFQKRILYISTTAAAVLLFGALFVFFFLN
ncbi:hypothetical protein GCM10011367_02810 [Marinicauda pacifica]|nr:MULTISPECIES: hypothetical protein [Marinicauda]GGE31827.1 hypothetical protein GCM10011367_02810 [Marinicauda pacifica]